MPPTPRHRDPHRPEQPYRESIIAAGETAPGFTLLTQNREEWNLADHLRAGDVVLCFFPFAFTRTCGVEMECLSAELDQWTKAGATCAGVSCDSHAALKAWSEQEGFRHTMLSDIHRAACCAYGLFWAEQNVAMRGTVLIGKTDEPVGIVKWSQAREPGAAMDFDQIMRQLK